MTRSRHRVLLGLLLACCTIPVRADVEADTLSRACPVCHGTPQSPSRMPDFYGASDAEIGSMLRAFRSGTRPGTAMSRIAAALTDAQIDALAARFGGDGRNGTAR